jgi:hypothetical protein
MRWPSRSICRVALAGLLCSCGGGGGGDGDPDAAPADAALEPCDGPEAVELGEIVGTWYGPLLFSDGEAFHALWGGDIPYVDRLPVTGGHDGPSQTDLIVDPTSTVIWAGDGFARLSNEGQIKLSRFDALGDAVGDATAVSDAVSHTVSTWTTLVATSDGYAAAWTDNSGGAGADLHLAILDDAGVRVGPDRVIASGASQARLLWNERALVILWSQGELGYLQRLGSDGDPDGAPVELSPQAPGFGWGGVAAASDSQIAVIGFDNRGLSIALIDETGDVLGVHPVSDAATLGAGVGYPQIVWNGSVFGMAWQEYAAAPPVERIEAFVGVVGPDGVLAGATQRVSTGDTDDDYVISLATAGDTFAVGSSKWVPEEDGLVHHIFAVVRLLTCDDTSP